VKNVESDLSKINMGQTHLKLTNKYNWYNSRIQQKNSPNFRGVFVPTRRGILGERGEKKERVRRREEEKGGES
tara:strand:- start:510 stop:728 length:219 start_codon:yes stop_codon:yes gene_type:complete